MQQQGAKVQVSLISARAPLPGDAVLMHQENSAPMHNLLSLANTESHNFTAEVLLRQGAGSWDLGQAIQRQTLWLTEQGLPMQGVRGQMAVAWIGLTASPVASWRPCS